MTPQPTDPLSALRAIRSYASAALETASAALETASAAQVEAKPWGEYHTLFHGHNILVARALIRAGGYSSLHRHGRKANYFIVQSGALRVAEHGFAGGPVLPAEHYSYDLRAGAMWPVASGCWHRFLAIRDTIALEVYTPVALHGEVDPADIERHDVNGLATLSAVTCKRCQWPLPVGGKCLLGCPGEA